MEVRNTLERPTLAVRTRTPVEKLSEIMGSCYGEIMQLMESTGVQPAGSPFAMYYNMDMSDLDVEIGFPIAAASQGSGRVKAGKLPGGRAAVTLHVGPYDKIGDAYNRLTEYVKQQGVDTRDFVYEFYLNDPGETAPEDLQTEIYFPLK